MATVLLEEQNPKDNPGGLSQNRCVDLIAVKFSISQKFFTIPVSLHQLHVSFVGP